MSELAVESTPDVAAAAHDAARGQVVYITEHGNRVAGIVPVELAAILDRLTTDELDQLAAAADLAGLINAAGLLDRSYGMFLCREGCWPALSRRACRRFLATGAG